MQPRRPRGNRLRAGRVTVAPRTPRQRVVDTYVRAYSAGDYEAAVSIFTEDVRWLVVGAFDITGRDAYLANMTNDHVSGHPDICVTRYFEDGDSVVAEGTVRQSLASGDEIGVGFLDVFEFRGDLVCEKRSYAIPERPLDIRAN